MSLAGFVARMPIASIDIYVGAFVLPGDVVPRLGRG